MAEERSPNNPGAWLTAVAKRRAIDGIRRHTILARKHVEMGRDRFHHC